MAEATGKWPAAVDALMTLGVPQCAVNVFTEKLLRSEQRLSCLYIYRVRIKSFPDYKHLLQENYVEYNHIFYHYFS